MEYDVREERRRELEFLEKVSRSVIFSFFLMYLSQLLLMCSLVLVPNIVWLMPFSLQGGNPLDFKFGHAASVSVQSTSHTYQHPDQILTRL